MPEIDEERRRTKLTDVADRWKARAEASIAELTSLQGQEDSHVRWSFPFAEMNYRREVKQLRSRRDYAFSRYESLLKPIGPRLDHCGVEQIPIACECDQARLADVRCRQWWFCPSCQEHRATQYEMRLRKSLDESLARAVGAWGARGARGMRPHIVLLTLTQRHSGDLALDVERLRDGWRTLYKRMHPEWGKFAYVWVWEVTPGRCRACDGYVDDLPARGARRRHVNDRATSADHRVRTPCSCARPDPEGHVHMHVAAVWGFRDFNRVRELWLRACPTSEGVDMSYQRWDGKRTSSGSVARYVGAYLSKGVDHALFTPTLRADISAAFYNAHLVEASRGFWLDEQVHTCRSCHTEVRRKRAIDAEAYDSLVREGHAHYWLTPSWHANNLPSLVLHVWGHGTGPPPDTPA